MPGRPGRRLREGERILVPDRFQHERAPDRRRERRPRHLDPVDVAHRDLAARIADPHRRLELRREPAEPRIGVVARRAGLAGGRMPEVGAGPGAVGHVLLEDLDDRVRDTVRDDALALGDAPARVAVDLAVAQHDLPDRHRLRVDAAGRERRVGGGHVERRDRNRPEPHGRDICPLLRRQRRADAELVGHLRHLLRPHVEGQLRVDGVVRSKSRVLDRDRAEVRVVVGRDVPRGGVRVGLVVERRRRVVRRRGVDAQLDRGREHERLEGRARLALRLGDEVELVALLARRHGGHGANRPVGGVDRDDRSGGVVARVERVDDRLVRRALVSRIDRRIDLEPAGADGVGAVLGDQLVADVAEEVRLADPRVQPPRHEVELPVRDRGNKLPLRDVAVVPHRAQDLVAPIERVERAVQRVVHRRRLRQARQEG